jgi:hypothetical protein
MTNILLSPEDDPRLGSAIGICTWGVSIVIAWWQFKRLAGALPQAPPRLSRQFNLRMLFLVVTAVAAAVWFTQEVWQAQHRRELLRAFMARGGETQRERIPGHWVTKALVVPEGQFTDDEIAELRAVFPDADVVAQSPPVFSRTN